MAQYIRQDIGNCELSDDIGNRLSESTFAWLFSEFTFWKFIFLMLLSWGELKILWQSQSIKVDTSIAWDLIPVLLIAVFPLRIGMPEFLLAFQNCWSMTVDSENFTISIELLYCPVFINMPKSNDIPSLYRLIINLSPVINVQINWNLNIFNNVVYLWSGSVFYCEEILKLISFTILRKILNMGQFLILFITGVSRSIGFSVATHVL